MNSKSRSVSKTKIHQGSLKKNLFSQTNFNNAHLNRKGSNLYEVRQKEEIHRRQGSCSLKRRNKRSNSTKDFYSKEGTLIFNFRSNKIT